MDNELDKIKKRRLEEMKRMMLLKQIKDQQEPEPEPEKPREASNQEILDAMFGNRAWEVYSAAAYQYPQVISQVEKILVEGIKEGKIADIIDGAALMGFFRQVGLPVRLNTKIRISEKGELKTLEQKMKEDES
ncbi:double-stranded DNA-binding protein [Candidatus Bathyarchaeota archaeon]|jgi:DNA-binding TFAR19-related protein (PDSD5 family)|nr:double-stranded DNA-binding protein [Candidatus Bathyarchaeota archaeon]MBT4319063.1 double-stranded DNA-binding protein [Candidatus Bathyarchaeota archaeon]MBT4424361.1 double-stranded DNA-binding protein [Candidatus Bathyarchaeota archaeon]MBT6604022.1 double-stranded DNA-binding protein [Candidatus Bathyarchaeota archaeon]MBT7187818.1 double-stranded DNA-binding protein [Candidatus Bathyarchaeota archaeon]